MVNNHYLGEYVSWILINVNLPQAHLMIDYIISNSMVPIINMFCPTMVYSNLAQIKSAFAIIIHHILSLLKIRLLKETFHQKHHFPFFCHGNVLCLSHGQSNTHLQLRLPWDISPYKVNKYPDVNVLQSISLAIYESMKPSRIGPLHLKHNLILEGTWRSISPLSNDLC